MTGTARYGVDWDVRTGRLVHPLTTAAARARDAGGEPFVVELRRTDGTVHAVVRMCGAQGVADVLVIGEQGGVDEEYRYVELWRDRLHLRRFRDFRQPNEDGSEDEDTVPVFDADIRPDGRARTKVVTSDGGMFETGADIPEQYRTLARPPFGDWAAYLHETATLAPDDDEPPGAADEALGQSVARPDWAAPPGLHPRHLQTLFTAGARLDDPYSGTAEITPPEVAGILHLPTGRVIAADPATLSDTDEPFTVSVPAGDHRVLIGHVTWTEDGWGEVTAAKLEILPDTPTITWELALRPGQDIRLLGERGFYGFGVDSGTGCFLDAAARDALTEDENAQRALCGPGADGYPFWTDPATGGSAISYPSGRGDGSYPVWVGRDAKGQVTCLVADMLILHRAEPLAPTTEDPAVYRLPATTLLPSGHAPACGTLAATADHMTQLRAKTVAMEQRIRARYRR